MADDDDDERRHRRSSTGMDDMSALPAHLQHEVFSRVGDVKALFRFAATCRGWLRRFTDRAFLRELCPGSSRQGSGHRACLLGVFLQDKWNRSSSSSSSACLAPVFLPALGSPLSPAGRALTSFVVGGDDDGTFDYAKPLAARRGIVLVRLAPRTPDEMECHLLAVCNPVTGDRHVLPPLEWSLAGNRANSYAIVTAADSHSDSNHPAAAAARWTFSQLFVITHDGDRPRSRSGLDPAHLYSYSAATRSWSAPTRCLNHRVFSLVGARSAVIHRGAAHWLCIDGLAPRDEYYHLYKLSVDVGVATAARVSLTRLPVRVGGEPLLCVSIDDKLVVATVYPVHVTVWTPPLAGDEDDTTPAAAAAAWPRTSFRIPAAVNYEERWFNFNHGSLLVLFRGGGGGVFILDLDTKVMDKVLILDLDNKASFLAASDANANRHHVTCVPCDMRWNWWSCLCSSLVAYES